MAKKNEYENMSEQEIIEYMKKRREKSDPLFDLLLEERKKKS